MQVVKASGERERFNPGKIEHTLRRAGAPREVRRRILSRIEEQVYDGITTSQILRQVRELLQREERRTGMRYELKGAIMRLGSGGFAFESYFAEVLESYGYATVVGRRLEGRCATHEVDIIAEVEGKRVMVECKYHSSPGVYTNLKEALYTYMRFLDLQEGGSSLEEVWLVTNTKASRDALRFARCRGMRLITWHSPRGWSLRELVESKQLYPVTVLPSVDADVLRRFTGARLILARDLVEADSAYVQLVTELPEERLEMILREARELVNGR